MYKQTFDITKRGTMIFSNIEKKYDLKIIMRRYLLICRSFHFDERKQYLFDI